MNIIKSSGQISEVFNLGTCFSSGEIRIIVRQVDDQRDPSGRVAFIAGKKLGNAVVRNRSKRVLREAARVANLPAAGYDILLMATSRTKTAAPAAIQRSLVKLLAKAGVR